MTFELALEAVRDGHRVRRPGWCDGISATHVGVHLEARDLLADDWELCWHPLDLAALWEEQANEPDNYHPAAQAVLRRCARMLRDQYPIAGAL